MSSPTTPPLVYDVVVVGAGPGAATARMLLQRSGRKVAFVAPDEPSGPCTWQDHEGGRVLTQLARTLHHLQTMEHTGVRTNVQIDLPEVFANVAAEAHDHWENTHWDQQAFDERQRTITLNNTPSNDTTESTTQSHSSDEALATSENRFYGPTAFINPQTVQVGNKRLQAKQFLLATSAACSIPALEGLNQVPYLTCSTLWDTPVLPSHLLVLGHHSKACEIAQIYSRLGAKVTLIRASDHLLPRHDPEVGTVLASVLAREGITIANLPEHPRAELAADGGVRLVGKDTSYSGSHLMVAVGSRPDTAHLQLEHAGVQVSTSGRVLVDDKLRSVSANHVYAVGHTVGRYCPTHVTQEQARVAARNMLLESRTRHLPFGISDIVPSKWNNDLAPTVVFTDPQVARAGLTETQAATRFGSKAQVAMVPLAAVERARGDSHTDGFIKLIAAPGLFNTKSMLRLVGITAVGPDAGELIAAGTLSMRANLPLSRLASTLAVSGTWAEAVRLAACLFFAPQQGLRARPANKPHTQANQ